MLFFNSFPLTAIMIVMLALLDDTPIMIIAYDNMRVDPKPVRWDMHRVITIAATLGGLSVLEIFGLLLIGKEVLHLPTPILQALVFLQLVAGGHLMLFLTRPAACSGNDSTPPGNSPPRLSPHKWWPY
ncbi:hypothetical protein ACSDBR_15115 [Acidithiobacillus ferriphilus]|uniref:hypothetical protein n=1 Tax=Acidithiobacillus ferriphilus TaxID=1689834 RepID=UPI001E3714BD|nr:hypothetical protein [Acidithiobacillus ferriphilus]UEP60168.1 hypothetical protein K1Y48_06015 [Acidithiobacillus ferriphilus]